MARQGVGEAVTGCVAGWRKGSWTDRTRADGPGPMGGEQSQAGPGWPAFCPPGRQQRENVQCFTQTRAGSMTMELRHHPPQSQVAEGGTAAINHN